VFSIVIIFQLNPESIMEPIQRMPMASLFIEAINWLYISATFPRVLTFLLILGVSSWLYFYGSFPRALRERSLHSRKSIETMIGDEKLEIELEKLQIDENLDAE